MSSTLSYSQTQDSLQNNVKCYNVEELKLIALSLINGSECKELLELAKIEIAFKDTLFNYSQRRAENFRKQTELQKAIIDDTSALLEDTYVSLNDEIKAHLQTKRRWRIGVIALGVVATTLLITK